MPSGISGLRTQDGSNAAGVGQVSFQADTEIGNGVFSGGVPEELFLHYASQGVLGDRADCFVWAGQEAEGLGDHCHIAEVAHLWDSGTSMPVGDAQDAVGGSVGKVQPLFKHAPDGLVCPFEWALGHRKHPEDKSDSVDQEHVDRINLLPGGEKGCVQFAASVTMLWMVASDVWLARKPIGISRCW